MSPARHNHGRRIPAAAKRRRLRWLARGGLEKAEKALVENTSGLTYHYSCPGPLANPETNIGRQLRQFKVI